MFIVVVGTLSGLCAVMYILRLSVVKNGNGRLNLYVWKFQYIFR